MSAVADIAVWPLDPDLVFVATALEQRDPPRHGVYRSADGGRSWTLIRQFVCDTGTSLGRPSIVEAQGVGQIVFAPDDPTKLWAAGGGCGVAYGATLDAGPGGVARPVPADAARRVGTTSTWRLVSSVDGRPVWHVAVGPAEAGGVRRVYACGLRTFHYSDNGGGVYASDQSGPPGEPRASDALAFACGPPSLQQGGAASAAALAIDQPNHAGSILQALFRERTLRYTFSLASLMASRASRLRQTTVREPSFGRQEFSGVGLLPASVGPESQHHRLPGHSRTATRALYRSEPCRNLTVPSSSSL